MTGLVLVTEVEQTQRAVTALIVLLLVVAVMLALLTFWYWRHTNPRRYVRDALPELHDDVNLRGGPPTAVWAPNDQQEPDPYAEARRRNLA